MEGEARLQEALTAGAVTAFEWDVHTGLSRRSENAAQILGFDPRQTLTADDFLARVEPADRERFKRALEMEGYPRIELERLRKKADPKRLYL